MAEAYFETITVPADDFFGDTQIDVAGSLGRAARHAKITNLTNTTLNVRLNGDQNQEFALTQNQTEDLTGIEVKNITFENAVVASVTDENTGNDNGTDETSSFTLDNDEIIADTLIGEIWDDGVQVADFVSLNGELDITLIGTPSPAPLSGTIDEATGALEIVWSSAPGVNHCVVSYNYLTDTSVDTFVKLKLA